MKIYLNIQIKEGERHPGQALIFCLCKRLTQQILFMVVVKREALHQLQRQ